MQLYSEQNLRDIETIANRFKRNTQGFLNEHHYLITLLIIAACVDAASTIYFMHTVGPHKEIHPHHSRARIYAWSYCWPYYRQDHANHSWHDCCNIP